MRAYLQLLSEVLKHGASKGNRTGIGSHSLFARQLRCDLSATFPLLTSKKFIPCFCLAGFLFREL